MIKNYFKIAWRNILKSKGYSAINIGGLAVGMAVAMLIGLWIYGEFQYNKSFENHTQIAQVMKHVTNNGEISTMESIPAVMGEEIRSVYGSDFKYVLQATWNNDHTLKYKDKAIIKEGSFFESGVGDMLSLHMLEGQRDGLNDMHNILLSKSVADAFFEEGQAFGKILKLDNSVNVTVSGVYEDFPITSSFHNLTLILNWSLYLDQNPWIEKLEDPWGRNFTRGFVQIADHASMPEVSAKIKNVMAKQAIAGGDPSKPIVFLQPMEKWHLYSDFKDGINTGGKIDMVWLFGIIGVFVLILACINFMNLSTARSEKRAKEVGIRKTVGSMRSQLVAQFYSESILITLMAFIVSIFLIIMILPYFNEIAQTNTRILWSNPIFWSIGLIISLFTGFLAGTYPALFLSSFDPVKVLKGTFKTGRDASLPRKILVVSQFAVSITLIIGTLVVYKQVKHAQQRPLGYEKDGLVTIPTTIETHQHFEAIREKLKSASLILEMTESLSPTTAVWNTNGGFDWEGKDPNQSVSFANSAVTHEYGKTIGWNIKEGRDFSRDFATDSLGFIANEAAIKFIGLKDPIGKTLKWNDASYTIIGVVKDVLTESPYFPVRPSLFHILDSQENVFTLKLNPAKNIKESIAEIEKVFVGFSPEIPFKYTFVDDDFGDKFDNEQKIGKLAALFTFLAIFISLLGLFGLASYVAEQRTKEIGIRKVLGATVASLWKMLSKDFIGLVAISCAVAIPLSYFFMSGWLQKYDYRTDMPWWIFGIACIGALVITVLTVSYQAIKAALMNPVKSLRSE